MRRAAKHLIAGSIAWAIITGCGSGGGGNQQTTGGGAAIAVSISPQNPASVGAGATQNFTATVTNDSANAGVTWGATLGSISATGLYTAPSTIAAASATVTATSRTDPTKSASVTVPLTQNSSGGLTINPISPATVALGMGGSQSFADTVSNDTTNSGVSWSIGSGPGTLSGVTTTNAIYNAPSTPIGAATTVTLTATSVKNSSLSTTATITLSPVAVSVAPTSSAMNGGSAQSVTATVSNDGTNAGVTWSVTGGGSFSLTTTPSGGATVYTAPNPSSASAVTLTATSKADPSRSASTTISVAPAIALNPISPGTATLGIGGSQAFTDTVLNDTTNSGVNWSITLGPGSLSGATTTSVTYKAPTTAIGSPTTATLTATSVKDPTKSAVVTINLIPVSVTLSSPATITLDGDGVSTSTIIASIAGDGTASGASFAVSGAGGTMSQSSVSGNSPSSVFTAPTVTAAGSTNITVASIADPTKTRTVAVTLNVPMSFTTNSLPAGSPSTAYSTTAIGVSGGTGARTFSILSGSLPAGLTMSSSGVISGTPTGAAGVSSFTVQVADQASTPGTVQRTYSITIGGPPVAWSAPSSAGTYTYTVGTAITPIPLSATGGTGAIAYTVGTGTLPQGLQIAGNQLTGTPTLATALSGNTVTFLATDSATPTPSTASSPAITLVVENPLAVTTTSASLATAVPHSAYNQTLAASGGTGTGYTWTVTSGATGANSLASLNLSISSAGAITGTPATTGTANFTVQVTDSGSNTSSASLSVSTTAILALPAPNPSSLGTAGINLAYSGSINASGGIAGYTWAVNGTTVPTNGSAVVLTDGLSVSNNGSTALVISGTPTATGSVTFSAMVKDSTGSTAGPFNYAVTVSNVYTVGGGVNLPACSPSPFSFSGITISIYTSPLQQPLQQPLQTATTQPNGSFSFANIPNGTYVLVPSSPNAVFSPATESVTVSGGNLSAGSFTATLGYSITGTVSYSGTQTGQIYLAAIPGNNCYIGSTGTSISAPGTFTIRGVPPGTYTLQAFMDTGANGGNGVPNANNPVGSTPGVTVTTSNVTGAAVTLNDPATVTLSTAPTITQVSGFNSGALAQYIPITNSGGVETASYYTFQWSTTANFTNIAGSKRFPANGTHNNFWLLNGLTNGAVYYFRAYGTSNGTLVGPYSPVFGPVTISAPTVGDTVTGTVSFAATQTGPMYTGFLDQGTGAFYGQYFPAPQSVQPYSIDVPPGSDYLFLGIVDQNNDGVVDANDVTNTGNGSSQPIVAVSGPLNNNNLTLPSTNGIATVTTQSIQSIASSTTTQSYALRFRVNGLIKLPVSATLVSGPNLITPVDIAICGGSGSNCSQGFQISFNLNGTSPNVGDTYTFNLTYSDGTTDTLTAAVSAVLNAYPTSLLPQTGLGSSTTPTFSWTDPANASNYAYQFLLTDSNHNTIWQIPGSAVASNGFSSSIASIAWGTDPTGGSSTPTVGSLTLNSLYNWQISAVDSYGNQAVTQVQYQP